jgi:hypothetical protein
VDSWQSVVAQETYSWAFMSVIKGALGVADIYEHDMRGQLPAGVFDGIVHTYRADFAARGINEGNIDWQWPTGGEGDFSRAYIGARSQEQLLWPTSEGGGSGIASSVWLNYAAVFATARAHPGGAGAGAGR